MTDLLTTAPDYGDWGNVAQLDKDLHRKPQTHIAQLLTDDGTASGSGDMTAATGIYYIQPPAGYVFHLRRVLVVIRDSGAFKGSQYGAISALTNGIQCRAMSPGGVLKDYTPQPIKILAHWGLLAGPDLPTIDAAANDNYAVIRWTFTKGGGFINLDGRDADAREWFEFNIRDSLSDLLEHTAQVQGFMTYHGEA